MHFGSHAKRLLIPVFAVAALAFATTSSANPIIIDPSMMEVVKRSENLEIEIGPEFSTIRLSVRYAQAPTLLDKESDDKLKYFELQIPVFTRTSLREDGENLLRHHAIEVSSLGSSFPVEFLAEFSRSDLRKSLRRIPPQEGATKSPLLDLPKGTKLVYFSVQLPVGLVRENAIIKIRYRQEHVQKGGHKYAYYVPLFENPGLWKELHKRSLDFRATIIGTAGIVPIVEDPEHKLKALEDRSGGTFYLLEPGQAFWIRVRTNKS